MPNDWNLKYIKIAALPLAVRARYGIFTMLFQC